MTEHEIHITTPDGPFAAFIVEPAISGPAPAIVVIQEIFGINANIRAIARLYAAQGYLAIAPDLFWRQEPGIQLTDQSEAEWARAFELLRASTCPRVLKTSRPPSITSDKTRAAMAKSAQLVSAWAACWPI
jgi:dienelactone hydrolase